MQKYSIYKLRKSFTQSQVDFAKKIGVSNSTVSCWENGRRTPSKKHLQKIAEEYNVSYDFILGNIQDGDSKSKHETLEIPLYDEFAKNNNNIHDFGEFTIQNNPLMYICLPKNFLEYVNGYFGVIYHGNDVTPDRILIYRSLKDRRTRRTDTICCLRKKRLFNCESSMSIGVELGTLCLSINRNSY